MYGCIYLAADSGLPQDLLQSSPPSGVLTRTCKKISQEATSYYEKAHHAYWTKSPFEILLQDSDEVGAATCQIINAIQKIKSHLMAQITDLQIRSKGHDGIETFRRSLSQGLWQQEIMLEIENLTSIYKYILVPKEEEQTIRALSCKVSFEDPASCKSAYGKDHSTWGSYGYIHSATDFPAWPGMGRDKPG